METQLVATVFCCLFRCWIPGSLGETTMLADSLVSHFFNTFFFQLSDEFGFTRRLLLARGDVGLLACLYSVESELCVRGC